MNRLSASIAAKNGYVLEPVGGPGTSWLNENNRLAFTIDNPIQVMATDNPMSFILGITTDTRVSSTDLIGDTAPDVSAVSVIFVHSSAIAGTKATLNSDQTKSPLLAVIPVTVENGEYINWQASFPSQWSISYTSASPYNLQQMDFTLYDLGGNKLEILAPVTMILEVLYD